MSVAAVEIDGLTKQYDDVLAVDRLSLSVPAGQVTAVLGPNGAGKTTTLECCEGYRRPDGGTVRVLGLDPHRQGRALRPRIGVMLQSGGVYPSARVREVIDHLARLYARPLDAAYLLERLGLSTVARTPYRELSGGQQQRLSLALAVVGRPELVFLDEPTAGLDPQARLATWDLIADLRRNGVSVVLTTHYMEEAERLADTLVVIDHGRVVASGPPATLTADRSETIRFSAPPALPLEALSAALPLHSVTESQPGTYVVSGDVTPDVLSAVTSWCAGLGVLPDNLSVGRRSLEEVFLDLTGNELRG